MQQILEVDHSLLVALVVTLWRMLEEKGEHQDKSDGKGKSSQNPRKCRITPRENQQARRVPPDCGPCDDLVEDSLTLAKVPRVFSIRSTCNILPVVLPSELAVRSSLLILRTPQEDGFQLQGVRTAVSSSTSLPCPILIREERCSTAPNTVCLPHTSPRSWPSVCGQRRQRCPRIPAASAAPAPLGTPL